MVAYTVRETNWDDNEYETEIWLGTRRETRQLTSGRKSSLQPAWSPDGKWLAFISDRDGKRQLYRIAIAGGEAERSRAATKASTRSRGRPTAAHRLDDDRSDRRQRQGAREEIRRVPDRGSGSPDGASVRADAALPARAPKRQAAHTRRLRRRQLRLVAGRARDRIRSSRLERSGRRRQRRHLGRRRSRAAIASRSSPRAAPTAIRAGRPTARASRS